MVVVVPNRKELEKDKIRIAVAKKIAMFIGIVGAGCIITAAAGIEGNMEINLILVLVYIGCLKMAVAWFANQYFNVMLVKTKTLIRYARKKEREVYGCSKGTNVNGTGTDCESNWEE